MNTKTFKRLVEESLHAKNNQLDEGFVKNLALAGALAGSVAAVSTPVENSRNSPHFLSKLYGGDSILVHKETGYNAAPYIETHHHDMIKKFGQSHPKIFNDLANNKYANDETFRQIIRHPLATTESLRTIAGRTDDSRLLHAIISHPNADADARHEAYHSPQLTYERQQYKDSYDRNMADINDEANERLKKEQN